MDSDNVYQNDGAAFFDSNPEVEKQVNKERNDTLKQLPLLEEQVEYLNQKIAFYGDVDSIAVDLSENPEAHRNQVAVNKMMKSELLMLKADIEARVEAARM